MFLRALLIWLGPIKLVMFLFFVAIGGMVNAQTLEQKNLMAAYQQHIGTQHLTKAYIAANLGIAGQVFNKKVAEDLVELESNLNPSLDEMFSLFDNPRMINYEEKEQSPIVQIEGLYDLLYNYNYAGNLPKLKEEIVNIDIDTLTPVEALMKLNEIKRMLVKRKHA